MTFQPCRLAVAVTTALAVAIAPIAPLAVAQTAGATFARADYEACQARDEAGFRAAVEAITRKSLRSGVATIDYNAAVADAWRNQNADKIIDDEVDKAVKNVREESSWAQLLKSLASKEKAQELATSVATRVYRSNAVKETIEKLATEVSLSVGTRIELATVDAAEPARKCMQAFLGNRFGSTVAGVVSTDAGNDLELDSERNRAKVSTGSVVLQGKEGLAGIMVLIVRRQMATIARRVGQRIAGAVLARLVSVVAGGVGLVLIAKDIWDFRHGVLPIISSEMKSSETKKKVREELASAIKEQIDNNVDELGTKSADRVVQIWQEFKQAHTKVLELTEKHPAFRSFLDAVPPQRMGQLDEVTALVLRSEGEAGVLKRLADGTLGQAVKKFSPEAMQIARDLRSLETAFQWRIAAAGNLPLVIKYGVHRKAAPKDFTKAGLARIFEMDDELAISRLVTIKQAERTPLFELDGKALKSLARALPASELSALAVYLTGLSREAAQRLLLAVAANPPKMHLLAKRRVYDALLASTDQLAAVNMMLRADGLFEPGVFMEDVSLLRAGKVSPWLIWERYPLVLSAIGIIALLFGMILWRLVFGRRPKVIVQAPAAAPSGGPGSA